MARTLKTVGLEELRTLKRRVNRQYGLGRIKVRDRDILIGLVNKLEAHITSMTELNEHGEEEYDG